MAKRAAFGALPDAGRRFWQTHFAVANSFTQFVPGHVHLKDLGQLVAEEIARAGGVAKEFNTIAIDDGIAMGHDGMLYSLPSREMIADSVEYMVNAHCADALVCISNCDKITPGMMMASLRLNLPSVFVSGGPMEAGKVHLGSVVKAADLIDAMVIAADATASDADVEEYERSACPPAAPAGNVYRQLHELPERSFGIGASGQWNPGGDAHADRKKLFLQGESHRRFNRRYYEQEDASALPRGIATFEAFENAMTLDIAMGGSTNTVLHLLAAAQEAGVPFTMADIDRLSRRVPNLCKVAPSAPAVHLEDVHRAGWVMGILGQLDASGLIHRQAHTSRANHG